MPMPRQNGDKMDLLNLREVIGSPIFACSDFTSTGGLRHSIAAARAETFGSPISVTPQFSLRTHLPEKAGVVRAQKNPYPQLRAPSSEARNENINTHVVRVEIQPDQLVIQLASTGGTKSKPAQKHRNVIEVPWRKTPSTRRRDVLVPDTGATEVRPIRSESRALLVASIARGRRWLKELMTDPQSNTEAIAGREGCSVRKINKTISLATAASPHHRSS